MASLVLRGPRDVALQATTARGGVVPVIPTVATTIPGTTASLATAVAAATASVATASAGVATAVATACASGGGVVSVIA